MCLLEFIGSGYLELSVKLSSELKRSVIESVRLPVDMERGTGGTSALELPST